MWYSTENLSGSLYTLYILKLDFHWFAPKAFPVLNLALLSSPWQREGLFTFHKCPARSHRGWLHILSHLVQFPLTHCTWLPLPQKAIGSSIQFIGIVSVCWWEKKQVLFHTYLAQTWLPLLSGEFPGCTWWIQEVVLLRGCGTLSDCCSQNSFPHPEKIKDMRRTDM